MGFKFCDQDFIKAVNNLEGSELAKNYSPILFALSEHGEMNQDEIIHTAGLSVSITRDTLLFLCGGFFIEARMNGKHKIYQLTGNGDRLVMELRNRKKG
jgi:predicted transcriptional regulator